MTEPVYDPRDRNHDGRVSISEKVYDRARHPWIKERQKLGPVKADFGAPGWTARLAVFVTERFGSMSALFVLVAWMIGWMAFAQFGAPVFRNDQYPFAFLLFLSNLVQLWALPVLAVGQQVQQRTGETRDEVRWRDQTAAFAEIDEIHKHLGQQDQVLAEVLARLPEPAQS